MVFQGLEQRAKRQALEHDKQRRSAGNSEEDEKDTEQEDILIQHVATGVWGCGGEYSSV